MQAINISGLNKFYGRKQVLFNIDLDFPQAQMVALIGPSGSGKSTLLRHINGLNVAESGQIQVNGQDLFNNGRLNRQVRQQRSKIGRIPKWRAYLRFFSQEEKQEAFDCLARVGLAEFVHQRASTLSGGQQQRVAIAKILMQQADIILADEPIASLDPESAKSVMNTLQAIHEQDDKTVIVTLHQVDYARRYCPRTVALKQGVVQFDGVTHELSDGFLIQLYGSEMRPEDAVPVTSRPVLNPGMAAITQ